MINYHKIDPPAKIKDWENHYVMSTRIVGKSAR
jgi:hypothetical protein